MIAQPYRSNMTKNGKTYMIVPHIVVYHIYIDHNETLLWNTMINPVVSECVANMSQVTLP